MINKVVPEHTGIFKKENKQYCGYCLHEIKKNATKCPNCGTVIYQNPYRNSKKIVNLTGYQIFENKNNSLTLKLYEESIVLDKKNKFRISKYIYPFHFRFDKGQIYKLPTQNGKTYKKLQKKGNVICNISYSPFKLSYFFNALNNDDLKKIISFFVNYTKNNFLKYDNDKKILEHNLYEFFKSKEGSSYYYSITNAIGSILFSLTKYHTWDINKLDFFSTLTQMPNMDISKYKYQLIRKYWFHENYMDKIQKIMDIKLSKEFKKLFGESFKLFRDNYKIGKLKIDTQNKIYQLFKDVFLNEFKREEYYRSKTFDHCYSFISLFEDENTGFNRLKTILLTEQKNSLSNDNEKNNKKHFLRYNTQEISLAHIVSSYLFCDTTRMLRIMKNSDIKIKKYLKIKNLKELHDKIAKIVESLSFKNYKIEHSNFELSLESEIQYEENKLYVQLCNQTREMVNIGSIMNNCVASYREDVINKECSILYAHENNKLVACIELRDKNLYQVKGYNNRHLDEKYGSIIKAWADKNKLNLKYCYDIAKDTKSAKNISILSVHNPLESLSLKIKSATKPMGRMIPYAIGEVPW